MGASVSLRLSSSTQNGIEPNQLVTLFVTEFTNLKLPEFLKRWDTINRQKIKGFRTILGCQNHSSEMLEQYIQEIGERTAG